jgi:hypothetical protein
MGLSLLVASCATKDLSKGEANAAEAHGGDIYASYTTKADKTTIQYHDPPKSDVDHFTVIFEGKPKKKQYSFAIAPQPGSGNAKGIAMKGASSYSFFEGYVKITKTGTTVSGVINGKMMDTRRQDTTRVKKVRFRKLPYTEN